MDHVRIHPEVRDAIESGAPVVALESAVITCGLPCEPMKLPRDLDAAASEWNASEPANLELARAMHRAVREAGDGCGAIPAIVAIIDDTLRIGLTDDDLVRVAADPRAAKAAATDLAFILAAGGTAGTTVSATLAACALTQGGEHASSLGTGIRVLATGGIGGVHRNWQQLPDISADLRALATTPVCVVCSGAKSILDIPATLEALETLGVPVIGFGSDWFPQFLCTGENELRLSKRMDDARTIGAACALHWSTLGSRSAIVLANPVPQRFAMNAGELAAAIEQAERLAATDGISGGQRTPFILAELARLTHGASLHANLALLLANARLAGELAGKLSASPK
jgi:pseudouridine-5'-phosphate glycosidase